MRGREGRKEKGQQERQKERNKEKEGKKRRESTLVIFYEVMPN